MNERSGRKCGAKRTLTTNAAFLTWTRAAVTLLAVVLSTAACAAEGPLTSERAATVTMRFLTPATVQSLVVEVTGPGIDPAVVLNIPVGTDTVATGALTLPSGSGRRFVVTAVDTAGVQTHRADTTIVLQPGTNPSLAMRLAPLPSTLGITVTFGGVRLVVPDTSTLVLDVGDTTTIVAYAIRANGDTVPADSLLWASDNPAVAIATQGLVTAIRSGSVGVTVSFGGAANRVGVLVNGAVVQYSQTVLATANVFGYGLTTPAPGGGGGGTLAPSFPLPTEARWVEVLATGLIGPDAAPRWSPDGECCTATNITSHGPISGWLGIPLPLVGVFLPSGDISQLSPTDPIPFNGGEDLSLLQYAPGLRQIFFIGDGRTGTGVGAVQRFVVPAGASRLVIGFADAWVFQGLPGWYDDNSGMLAVTMTIRP